MKHLTWNDVFELIDGPSTSPRRAELEQHLAECAPCKKLLESQRSFERIARTVPPAEPSQGFTGRVVAVLQNSRKERNVLRLLASLGVGTAMVLVALLIGYAISLGPLPQSEGTEELFGGASGTIGTAYEWVQSRLGSILGETSGVLGKAAQTDVVNIATLAVGSVFLLLIADRLFLRRMLRSRL